jgi:uncharacterized membrane protein YhaH (DUF805 family)
VALPPSPGFMLFNFLTVCPVKQGKNPINHQISGKKKYLYFFSSFLYLLPTFYLIAAVMSQ